MLLKKKFNSKKFFMRKRRVNIMLKNLDKKDSFFNIINSAINILITFIIKIFILKLIITFYKIVISSLKLNKLKSLSRFSLIINSLFELIQLNSLF